MKSKKSFIIIFCLFILGFVLSRIIFQNTPILELDGERFHLKTALSESDRIKGLSGRPNLSSNSGLLFVFEKEHLPGIWMKDMNFPISIIWLDSNCMVTGFKALATPQSYPEVFMPEKPSRFVVEVNPLQKVISVGTKLECQNFIK